LAPVVVSEALLFMARMGYLTGQGITCPTGLNLSTIELLPNGRAALLGCPNCGDRLRVKELRPGRNCAKCLWPNDTGADLRIGSR
jgi:hypothetical protein